MYLSKTYHGSVPSACKWVSGVVHVIQINRDYADEDGISIILRRRNGCQCIVSRSAVEGALVELSVFLAAEEIVQGLCIDFFSYCWSSLFYFILFFNYFVFIIIAVVIVFTLVHVE